MGRRLALLCSTVVAVGVAGCAGGETMDEEDGLVQAVEVQLGPTDGFDLPRVALERVAVGDVAPDFSLASLEGPVVTLSDLRGDQNVVLVFYRGHW